jgi:hypothetical protein
MSGGSGMGGMMGGMGGGGKEKKNKKRPPVQDFQPKGEKKEYHSPTLKAREPVPSFQPSGGQTAKPSSYHKGGKVRKSGKANVLKGEEVLTAKQAKEYHKVQKVAGAKTKSRFRKSGNKKSARTKKIISK